MIRRRLSAPARRARGAAAARALRPHPVVRAQVPVLRLQLARARGRACRRASTSTRCCSTSKACCLGLGPAPRQRLHRRRHAEPLLAGVDRRAALGRARALAARARRRDHARRRIPARWRRRASAASARAGVNRISIGVQSFDERMLAALGRIHSADEARRAIDAALASFDNVNLDLMYALPAQSAGHGARRPRGGAALRRAAPLGLPAHDRAEHRVLEQAAAAARARRRPRTCSSRPRRRLRAGTSTTRPRRSRGPGRRCRHNLNYWEFGDYLGIGAGAHGKISFPDRITRHARAKQPREYLKRARALSTPARVESARARAAVRVHAECAAPGGGLPTSRSSASAPACRSTVVGSRLGVGGEATACLARDWKRIGPTERGADVAPLPQGSGPLHRAFFGDRHVHKKLAGWRPCRAMP